MGKGSKQVGKGAKGERRAQKAESSRGREGGRRRHKALDQKEVQSFARFLRNQGFELNEVARDGVRSPFERTGCNACRELRSCCWQNCFFRSLSDQIENHEHNYQEYRERICDHLDAHEDEFSPFMSFGESEE